MTREGDETLLQGPAAAHLVLVPLATWWGHGLAERAGLGGLGNTISELVLMLATLALLLWSMRKVQRAAPPAPSA